MWRDAWKQLPLCIVLVRAKNSPRWLEIVHEGCGTHCIIDISVEKANELLGNTPIVGRRRINSTIIEVRRMVWLILQL